MRIALYPGSFDPITNGHIDIIKRSLKIFDKVVIGVGINAKKTPLFTFEERAELIKISCGVPDLQVATFHGLVVDFAKEQNACAIIRGLRNNPDFESEFAFAHINTRMAPEIEHIYFMTSEQEHFVSSSVVKELWTYGSGYKTMVPEAVFNALEKRRNQ